MKSLIQSDYLPKEIDGKFPLDAMTEFMDVGDDRDWEGALDGEDMGDVVGCFMLSPNTKVGVTHKKDDWYAKWVDEVSEYDDHDGRTEKEVPEVPEGREEEPSLGRWRKNTQGAYKASSYDRVAVPFVHGRSHFSIT